MKEEWEINIIARQINSLYIKQTDCVRTYNNIILSINKCISLIKDLKPLELFEVIIRLTNKGLEDFKLYLYNHWIDTTKTIWEKRKLNNCIKNLNSWK